MLLKNKYYILFLLYFILTLNTAIFSKEKSTLNASIGAAGSFGMYDIYARKGENNWKRSIGYGGGLIFEKMFSNRFGIHSGLWATESYIFHIDELTGSEFKIRNRTVSFPFLLITSFNASSISINFLAGPTFSYIFYSRIVDIEPGGSEQADIIKFIKYNQAAITGGINIKFRVGRFTDLFIGGTADFYVTTVLSEFSNNNGNFDHSYNFKGFMGILFRTNLFPISENN